MNYWVLDVIAADMPSNEELFNFIISTTQSTDGEPFDKEVWWWNDKDDPSSVKINLHSTDDAITFITDYVEANEGTKIRIKFIVNGIDVELETADNYYVISEDFEDDAHNKIFTMVLWVIAKSLGYGEEI